MKHVIGAGIVFLILLIEDFLVGCVGHYEGSGSDGSFFDYIFTIPLDHIIIIFIASIIIYMVLTMSPLRRLIRA